MKERAPSGRTGGGERKAILAEQKQFIKKRSTNSQNEIGEIRGGGKSMRNSERPPSRKKSRVWGKGGFN